MTQTGIEGRQYFRVVGGLTPAPEVGRESPTHPAVKLRNFAAAQPMLSMEIWPSPGFCNSSVLRVIRSRYCAARTMLEEALPNLSDRHFACVGPIRADL